jgi:enoyl-CoA hydratase/carnithine racemase
MLRERTGASAAADTASPPYEDSPVSLVELRVEEHVAVVTLSRPEALNAISGEMANEVAGAVLQAAATPSAWVVTLAAKGERAFCVGADLKERNTLDDAGWMRNRYLMRSMFESVRAVPQPTIASVFGFALGGGFELALSCDLIVAAEDAVFGLPETRVGILPGGGGTQLLARRIGVGRAKDLIFTGRRVSASEAHQMGVLNRLVPRADLEGAVRRLAAEICGSSPVAVREAKHAVDRAFDASLEEGIDLEELAWRRAVASEDRREGIAAWGDGRDPVWKGR